MNEHTEQYKKIVKKVLIGTGFAFVLIIGILVGRLSNAQPDTLCIL
jgi:hypothetical protein